MELEFSGELWFWRGPAPFHFVTVPEDESAEIHAMSPDITYGWGMIPVTVEIGSTTFTTALWPKDGQYLVPVKAAVRDAEGLALGDVLDVRLSIDVRPQI